MAYHARAIAFYLPQFHPTPENDRWYGVGFTEWTNVQLARPLFAGHDQPRRPGELGYYDLSDPAIRQAQARLAQAYGIEAFCYWHYWFGGGRRMLEMPFKEVLRSGQPDFPFCLAWANASWRGVMYGKPDEILIQQEYPGEHDIEAHFKAVLPAFQDSRYVNVRGRKLFVVFDPPNLPDPSAFVQKWQTLALDAGLSGIHFVGVTFGDRPRVRCFDGITRIGPFGRVSSRRSRATTDWKILGYSTEDLPLRTEYRTLVEHLRERPLENSEYPTILPGWDNTPRAGKHGSVLLGPTPALFGNMVHDAVVKVRNAYPSDERLIFLQAWNEWGEGAYLEPDERFGRGYLEELHHQLTSSNDLCSHCHQR